MAPPDKKCTRCGLWNSGSALVCDCGFDFKSGQATVPPALRHSSGSATLENRNKLEKLYAAGVYSFFWMAFVQVLNAFTNGQFPATVLYAVAATSLVIIGLLARQQYTWSLVVGMIVYSLDLLICLAAKDVVDVAIQIICLIWAWRGFQALRLLSTLDHGGNSEAICDAMKAVNATHLYRTPSRGSRAAFWFLVADVVLFVYLHLRLTFLR